MFWGLFQKRRKKEEIKQPVFNFSCVYNCINEKCPKWVKLTVGEKLEGKCSDAWLPILLVELRQEIQNGHVNKVNSSPS
uniref:Uncharacterized protein n=1 Tax=viral metagenome TaxID=1070528 RepID=A0A6H1ZXI3_9ZZZZ